MDRAERNQDNNGRWFVSVELPEAVREELAKLRTRASRIRWTPPQQYHLTLRFIGETDPEIIRRVASHLAEIRVEPFLLQAECVGAFPSRGRARVLWTGLGSGHPRLFQLQQKVEEAAVRAGLEPEMRRFHPHITLARCGDASTGAIKEFLKTWRDYRSGPFRVTHFSLFTSRLGRGGAVHEEVVAYPLNPA